MIYNIFLKINTKKIQNTMAKSYMDFFQKNCTKNMDETVNAIVGTCNSMCPEEEVKLRQKENMVHILEVVNGKHRLVKCYSRPAADTNLAVQHNLRTFQILRKTVDYLLFEVTQRKDVSQLAIYNFVTDRLRAVRQDMIIQDFLPKQRIILLEPMIRFHTYYGHLLCEESVHDYSPTLNRNFLMECLKTCLFSYDELDRREGRDLDFIIDNMYMCRLENNYNELSLDRGLMEAIYVLTNLYEESPMWRLHQMNESIWHLPVVRLAYKIAFASLHNNYVAVCKSLDNLCPLLFCAVAVFLPRIQRTGLQMMNVAYSSKVRAVPLDAVRSWLRLGDDVAAAATLRHYGLQVLDGLVTCQRAAFNHQASVLSPRKIKSLHLEGKMNLDYILTYTQQNK